VQADFSANLSPLVELTPVSKELVNWPPSLPSLLNMCRQLRLPKGRLPAFPSIAPIEYGLYHMEKVIRASGEKFRGTRLIVMCHILQQALNACQKLEAAIVRRTLCDHCDNVTKTEYYHSTQASATCHSFSTTKLRETPFLRQLTSSTAFSATVSDCPRVLYAKCLYC
jgi:hypothetical protein